MRAEDKRIETQLERNRLAYGALAAVCVFWGTTYLGIRIALESLPPLYLIAIRYTISGGILLVAGAAGRFSFAARTRTGAIRPFAA